MNMCVRRVAALVGTALCVLAVTTSAQAVGGPIVLAGIDAEDGGPGGHGPIANYQTLAGTVLADVTNGGSGILGIGCGKAAGDHVTTFWNAIASGNGTAITCVNDATIGVASFAGYAMIGIASDNFNTPSGGLTNAENTALAGRSADIAAFVNGGGGLLGFSNAALTTPYPYLGGIGAFTFGTVFDADITPTAAGLAVGITNALDVCCWHDSYLTFPSFLSVLATYPNSGNEVAALGGESVTITTMSLTPATATLNTGDTHCVTAHVQDQNRDPLVGVMVHFSVSGANTTSGSAVTDALGDAAFCYVGTTQGSDQIDAYADLDSDGIQDGTEPFGVAEAEWVNSPPDCSAVQATGPSMWPPNHKLRSFRLGGATDPDGDTVTLTVTGVTQDEPVNGLGDGDVSPDAFITGAGAVDIRSERAGKSDGRVYVVTVRGDDGNGATCFGSVSVQVPHDKSGPPAVDSGQLYNSLLP